MVITERSTLRRIITFRRGFPSSWHQTFATVASISKALISFRKISPTDSELGFAKADFQRSAFSEAFNKFRWRTRYTRLRWDSRSEKTENPIRDSISSGPASRGNKAI